MPLDALDQVDIIETMENYLEKARPPQHIRPKLDIQYSIEGQSIILLEVRPVWDNPSEYRSCGYAKATYVKSKKIWKLYWMRGNLQWYPYDIKPQVKTLKEFLQIVDEDKYHCFKG